MVALLYTSTIVIASTTLIWLLGPTLRVGTNKSGGELTFLFDELVEEAGLANSSISNHQKLEEVVCAREG